MSVKPDQRVIYERYKPTMDAAEANWHAWMLLPKQGHLAHRANRLSAPLRIVTPRLVAPDCARQEAIDRSAARLIRGAE